MENLKKEQKLVFIVSQPRSGSTFLQSLICDGKQVITLSEPWLLFPFALFHKPLHKNDSYNYKWFKVAFEDFAKKRGGKSLFYEKMKVFIKDVYFSTNKEASYFVDKTPRYYDILDFITEAFPEEKIIILKRNPSNVLKSIISTWNVDGLKKLNDYRRDLLEAPYLMHDFLKKNVDNKNVLEVKYEALVVDKELEMKRICEFLKIPFDISFTIPKVEEIDGIMGDVKIQNKKHARSEFATLSLLHIHELEQGYLNYFKEGFLTDYGYPLLTKGKKTKLFTQFLKMNSLQKLIFEKIQNKLKQLF